MKTRTSTSISSLSRALNKSVHKTEIPLAAAYRAAVVSVCGVNWAPIRKSDDLRFAYRQNELDALGIDYQEYAATVVKTWWGWCQLLDMKTVPATIFCGPKALARFLRDKERHSFVTIDSIVGDDHQERIAEETIVAYMYLGGYPFVALLHIRDVLAAVQNYPPDPGIVAEVLGLLNAAYGFDAENYEQLAQQHRKRYPTYGTHSSSATNQAIQIEGVGVSAETWLGD